MAMSYIWTGMVLVSIVFSLVNGAGGALSKAVVDGAQAGVTLLLSMAGAICLWSGLGQVMERSALNRWIARGLMPVIGRLFPTARRDEQAGNMIAANVCANLLGLGNAATPMGVAATQRLSRYAPEGTASHEMCRLIVMNTASIQLIPANVAALRASLGSQSPFSILPAVWLTSLCSVGMGLLAAYAFQKGCGHD